MSKNLSSHSATVYVDYDKSSPPPHPGEAWTRFICISDTHSRIFPVPDGDVLLHSGDLSSWGYPQQLEYTLAWMKTLTHPVKILIAGNHDLCLDATLPREEQVMLTNSSSLDPMRLSMRSQVLHEANIFYLEHESIIFTTRSGKKWSVYGSPSSPRYALGAFQYWTDDGADAVYKRIPPETEILLTHTPPHLILDQTRRGKNAGCKHLSEKMKSLDQCRLHVFGHIHEGFGADIVSSSGSDWRVVVNAALADQGAQAIIVDLKN